MSSSAIPTIDVTQRTKLGTRYAKRDREAGFIPAVIYGHKETPVHVTLHSKTFTDLLHDDTHILDINLEGKSEHTLIKAVQWDTFGRFIVHVDLERVNMSETIEVEVELQLTGEPAALKEAGTVLDHPTMTLKVSCRADAIPSHLEHSIADLELGDPVTVADLTLPEGITAVTSPEQLVCQISGVKVSAADEETMDGADEAEPEVIGKDKEDKDGD